MSNNQNPWGGPNNSNRNSQTPPDLDEAINELKSKVSSFFGGGSGNGNNDGNDNNAKVINEEGGNFPTGGIKFAIIIAIIVWLGFGFYIIDPAERGVVLRFGSVVNTVDAGPHWHLPYPIDKVEIVNVAEVRKAEIGFRSVQNNNGSKFTRAIPSESIMLTSDGNIVDVSFEVQYTISDIEQYLLNIKDPERTLEQVANSVIREVVGKHEIDYIITEGRADIASEVKQKSQELLNVYKIGLNINTINFKSAQAPVQVQAAYSDVTKAKADKERYINQAQSYANDILPKARGRSARMLEEANAYKSEVISRSEGESSRFLQILAEYTKAPVVTKERLYRETIEKVLAGNSKVITSGGNNSLMYLPIDKLMNRENQNSSSTTQNSSTADNAIEDSTTGDSNIRNAFRNRGGK